MNKSYNRINWENYPSDKTPINEQNLNKIDASVDEQDNRIITLDETKATKVEVSTLFKEVEYDEKTGIITFTRKNGAKVKLDTPMEKIALNIYYDPVAEMLTLPLIDGTQIQVDLSRLITEYEFVDSDTIAFFVGTDGKVTAIVKEGSIEEKHLRPNYLADIKVEVAKAQSSASAAATSEANAEKSAAAAKASQTAAKTSEDTAAASAQAADQKATAAANSANTADQKATDAANSATTAAQKATAAAGSATTADQKAAAAETSATNAADSATASGTKATEAGNYATQSKSYAHGGTGTREGEDADNAQYYYEQAKRISQSQNGIIPMGTISFADLSDPNNQSAGYLFNISDSFVSDERFTDGGGIFYGAGNNLLYTADGMWDVLAASMVSGMKGAAETEYRQGFVDISKENIGLGNVANERQYSANYPQPSVTGSSGSCTGNAATATKATQDKNGNDIADTYLPKTGDAKDVTVTFESGDSDNPTGWINVALFTAKEKLSSLIRKASLMNSNMKYLLKLIGNTPLSIGDGTITGAISSLNTGLTVNITITAGLPKHSYIVDDGVIFRYGKIVIFSINTNLSGTYPIMQNVNIIYGLPKAVFITFAIFYSNGHPVRVNIDANGILSIYLPHNVLRDELAGQLVYVTDD